MQEIWEHSMPPPIRRELPVGTLVCIKPAGTPVWATGIKGTDVYLVVGPPLLTAELLGPRRELTGLRWVQRMLDLKRGKALPVNPNWFVPCGVVPPDFYPALVPIRPTSP